MNKDKEIISDFISTLELHGFHKTVDAIGDYSPNADLYYRLVDKNRYLVFNHYAKKSRAEFQGFDCWVSTYNSEHEIGTEKAQHVEQVQLSFQIERDWHFIEQYL